MSCSTAYDFRLSQQDIAPESEKMIRNKTLKKTQLK
jgi:hypothetical protein